MAMTTAANAANRWAQGMSGASEKMKAGILAVTEAPTAKAARRSDAYLQGVQRALASGKYQASLERVTLQEWQKAAVDKGLMRVASGAAEAKPKFQAFMSEFLPYVEQAVRELDAMPRGDLEQNIARATTMMRKLAQFKRSR